MDKLIDIFCDVDDKVNALGRESALVHQCSEKHEGQSLIIME